MHLSQFPRVSLAFKPTPLEPLDRLSDYLGGPRIYIKRDDLTGLATGGNKARKLEFLVADALAVGADTLVTVGGVQSNHARQTAAAAARLGLRCELLLENAVERSDPAYESSGNVLLDQLLGARIHRIPRFMTHATILDDLLIGLRSEGATPYWIPVGGSTALGALGYADATQELLQQTGQWQRPADFIYVGTGSGGTHAGIVTALHATASPTKVIGVAVSATRAAKEEIVRRLATETATLVGISPHGLDQRVHVDDDYVGAGYGVPTSGMVEAVKLVARLEGILLDPVYTGKAMACLIDHVRRQQCPRDSRIIFWHTGGTSGLFAYPNEFYTGDSPYRS